VAVFCDRFHTVGFLSLAYEVCQFLLVEQGYELDGERFSLNKGFVSSRPVICLRS
jgi:hypothetical protein